MNEELRQLAATYRAERRMPPARRARVEARVLGNSPAKSITRWAAASVSVVAAAGLLWCAVRLTPEWSVERGSRGSIEAVYSNESDSGSHATVERKQGREHPQQRHNDATEAESAHFGERASSSVSGSEASMPMADESLSPARAAASGELMVEPHSSLSSGDDARPNLALQDRIGEEPSNPALRVERAESTQPNPALRVERAESTQHQRERAEHASPREQDAHNELALLRRAKTMMELDPRGALRLLERHRRRFPQSSLATERDALWVLSLCFAGQSDQALARFQRVKNQPGFAAYLHRIDRVCGPDFSP